MQTGRKGRASSIARAAARKSKNVTEPRIELGLPRPQRGVLTSILFHRYDSTWAPIEPHERHSERQVSAAARRDDGSHEFHSSLARPLRHG